MPHIHAAFPTEISPHTEHAEQSARAFVKRFGLVPDEVSRHHHARSLLGTLMSRAYPRSGPTELALVTEWISCNLVLDDQFDETSLGRDPERLRAVCAKVLSWLTPDGSLPDEEPEPGEHSVITAFRAAYTDLWQRTRPYVSDTWRVRMAAHLGEFFETCAWEVENRLARRTPEPDEYIARRRCAFMPYIDLIEVTTHAEVPEHIYTLPEFTEMNASLCDADLWTNDLFSCEKEALLGDPHNLVLVHQHAHGTDMQTSADAVGEMIQERFDRFSELSLEFPGEELVKTLDPDTAEVLRNHVAGMRSWLTGQLRWRYETKRFDPERAEVTNATGSTPL